MDLDWYMGCSTTEAHTPAGSAQLLRASLLLRGLDFCKLSPSAGHSYGGTTSHRYPQMQRVSHNVSPSPCLDKIHFGSEYQSFYT